MDEPEKSPPDEGGPGVTRDDAPDSTPSTLAAALAYAEAGWPIFPCRPSKAPYTRRGFIDASKDPEIIKRWWLAHPDALIGLPTGQRTALVVIDVDVKEGQPGIESARALAAQYGQSETRKAQTASGGYHLYFQHPGAPVKSRTGFRPGIDIRADGGYVIAPPSQANGRAYRWLNRWAEIEALPEGLAAELTADEPRTRGAAGDGEPIPKGGRNAHLASLAGSMRRRGMTPDAIAAALKTENAARCDPPLPDREVEKIAESVGRYKPESEATGTSWPDPLPLPSGLPPVAKFEPELLPLAFRPWIADVAERMQAPPDFPAVAAMVAFSATVGRSAVIYPLEHGDWAVVPNLWGAVIGRPGLFKTPAMAEARKPIATIQRELARQYDDDRATWETENEILKARLDAAKARIKKRATPEREDEYRSCKDDLDSDDPPPCPRIEVNDATVEKLGEILVDNPNGVLLFRDELVSWIRGLDREGYQEARGFYLTAWDGSSGYQFDRIVRGSTRIDAVCISVLGGIQPGPLRQYTKDAGADGLKNDGLLQRFQLMVWPDVEPWRQVDRAPDAAAYRQAFAAFEGARARVSGVPTQYRFDPEALGVFNEWRQELETQKLRQDEGEALEAHLSKYRSLCPSLALLCHLADGGGERVTVDAVARAAAWCEYLEAHARRVYGSTALAGIEAARRILAKVESGHLLMKFTPRDVYRAGWSGLDRDATMAGLEVLEDHEIARLATLDTGGRPTQIVTVNPKVVRARG